MAEALGNVRVERHWPWFLLPAAGAVWAALALRGTYFFQDEWSMIDRVMHLPAGDGTFASFNGHLWMFQYWLYRAQVSVFGVDDHLFVSVIFVISLVLLHLSIAAVLRAASVPPMSCLLVGGLLTYLGVASQNFIFAIQTSTALATAACLAAAALVLERRPTLPSAGSVALLMLAAVGLDSGTALAGLAFTTPVVLLTWRLPWTFAALPSVLALAAWYRYGDLGPEFPATAGERAWFAVHLVLRAAGGLIGQGEITGVVIIGSFGAVVALGLYRRWIDGAARTMLAAGVAATAVVTAGLARSRAGIVGSDFVNFNRYLQNVAVPLVVGVVPAFAAVLRRLVPDTLQISRSRAASLVAPAAIVVAVAFGIAPMRSYSKTFNAWNDAARHQVHGAAVVIRDGCPSGEAPEPTSQPLGDLSPQVTTQLLRDLIARGALVGGRAEPQPDVIARMCPTTGAPG